ncbi:hypothetical protein D9757_001898 [Collybiopsis confluens]|uniref:Kinesin motor domain-containing protein n=1 Tax=Collybiopsis confluens TaxID=2823264 RepID=A0A8H5HYD8_9AGAR|nr:hypothetical protein D9757_001898 [Collybiopsis confluens]
MCRIQSSLQQFRICSFDLATTWRRRYTTCLVFVCSTPMTSVRIIARLRPPLPGAVCDDGIGIVSCDDKENRSEGSSTLGPGIVVFKGTSTQHYPFHSAYGSTHETSDLFLHDIHPLLDQVLSGATESVSIFSYGVTSSGKTYTMQGNGSQDRGLIGLVVDEIFRRQPPEGHVAMSYLELYLDSPFDLLSSSRQKLDILSTVSAGTQSATPVLSFGTSIYLPHLSIHPIQSVAQFQTLYSRATKNRSTGATKLNAHSSRSHSVLTLYVSGSQAVSVSKVHLLDLAGSENNNLTGNVSKGRMKESSAINQSLTALGRVVSILNDNARTVARARKNQDLNPKMKLVPYRSSSLTRLLSDALSGTSLSALIVCLAPETKFRSDLIRSVGFASQARRLERKVDSKRQAVPTKNTFDLRVPFGSTLASSTTETAVPAPTLHSSNSLPPFKSPTKSLAKRALMSRRRASLIPVLAPQFGHHVNGRQDVNGAPDITGGAGERSLVSKTLNIGFMMTEEEIQDKISKAVQIEVERRLEEIRQEERLHSRTQGIKDKVIGLSPLTESELIHVTPTQLKQEELAVDGDRITQHQSAAFNMSKGNEASEVLRGNVKLAEFEGLPLETTEPLSDAPSEEKEEEIDQLIDDDPEVDMVEMNKETPRRESVSRTPLQSHVATSSLSHSTGHFQASPSTPISGSSLLLDTATISSSTSDGKKRKSDEIGSFSEGSRKRPRRKLGFYVESNGVEDEQESELNRKRGPKEKRSGANTGRRGGTTDPIATSSIRYARAWVLQARKAQRDKRERPLQALALYRRASTFAPDNVQLQDIINKIEHALETNSPLPPSPKPTGTSSGNRHSSLANGKRGRKNMNIAANSSSSFKYADGHALNNSNAHLSSSSVLIGPTALNTRMADSKNAMIIGDEASEKSSNEERWTRSEGQGDNTTQTKGKGKARAVSVTFSEAGEVQPNQTNEHDEWEIPSFASPATLAALSGVQIPDANGACGSGSTSTPTPDDESSILTNTKPSPPPPPPPIASPSAAQPSLGLTHEDKSLSIATSRLDNSTLSSSFDADDVDEQDLKEMGEVAGVLNEPAERGGSVERYGTIAPTQKLPKLDSGSGLHGIKEEDIEMALSEVVDEDSVSEWEDSPKKKTKTKLAKKAKSRPKSKRSSDKSEVPAVHEPVDAARPKMRYVYGSSDDERDREEVFVRDLGAPLKRKRLNVQKRRNKRVSLSSLFNSEQ